MKSAHTTSRNLLKLASLFSVVRGYNILALLVAQYFAAIFIFSPQKSIWLVFLDVHVLFLVLSSVFVVAGGYIINNFYDSALDTINRPIKTKIDAYVSQHTKLQTYFLLNALGFFFGFLVSWRAALFFSVYIFAIWLYSHKLKKHPILGIVAVSILTILPFFALFIYFRNFVPLIGVHALFLFLLVFVKELVKDLEALKGAIVSGYKTCTVAYGEKVTKQLITVAVLASMFPSIFLFSHPSIGAMKYYFYTTILVLFLFTLGVWKSTKKAHYVLLHTVLKLVLLAGIVSIVFIDPAVLLEKVLNKLH